LFNFNRKQLNWIIIIIVITIVWLRWPAQELAEDTPPPPLTLSIPEFQIWSTEEQVPVLWINEQNQPMLTTSIHALALPKDEQHILYHGSDMDQAVTTISSMLNAKHPAYQQPSQVILYGPWSEPVAKLLAAKIIKSLALKPALMSEIPKGNCEQLIHQLITDASCRIPANRLEHTQWREQLASKVNTSEFHIDFITHLTYHRCDSAQWQQQIMKSYLMPLTELQSHLQTNTNCQVAITNN